MKYLRKETARNNFVLLFCVLVFFLSNILVYFVLIWQENLLLNEYQQINELVLMNNERKTSFKLYCKSHEEIQLQSYYGDCEILNQKMEELESRMQYDNNCKMMYRLVCQVLEHSQNVTKQYIGENYLYSEGTIQYLDEVDLELERCINQLVNHYLEYLNQIFKIYSSRLKATAMIVYVFFIGGCFYTYWKNYHINRKIFKSIDNLSEAAKAMIRKNFETEDLEESSFVELNQLSATFDHMKHTIKDMIVELKEKHQMKEHLAEAKIRELQMQMNPHFLFNTLNLVVRNIQMDQKETSIQLVNAISKILRSSIEIKELAIPLDEEIELLQAYLYIQKLSLRGRIDFYLDVKKSFGGEEIKIPPLTIQPLVENSVQHGLKNKLQGGKVEITILEKAEYVEVVVADNGVGFPAMEDHGENRQKSFQDTEDRGENRQESFQDAEERGEEEPGNFQDAENCGEEEPGSFLEGKIAKTSIGMKNVEERLKLYFRQEDVMRVERIEDMTRIILKLYKAGKREE